VVDFKSSAGGNTERFNKYFHGMLNNGIYLPPSSFESYFLNDALTNEDIDKTINSLSKIITEL
jgi:glutamate-1-semialdehyde 2,1-aminomutase